MESSQMKKTIVERQEMKCVGIQVRTNNQKEIDKMSGNIFPCIQRYFHQALFAKIPHRKSPGTTYCAYTNYESDYQGDYTYFIGEEVTFLEPFLAEEFQSLIIPAQSYAKFTTPPAAMPEVIINAWQHVWQLSPENLGGRRRYLTDFEVYDERAADHQNIVLDLFIGIEV
jgi:predicted transcriptional regulator YdeE